MIFRDPQGNLVTMTLVARISDEHAGIASSMFNAGQQVGGAVGLAVIGSVALTIVNNHLRHALARVSAGTCSPGTRPGTAGAPSAPTGSPPPDHRAAFRPARPARRRRSRLRVRLDLLRALPLPGPHPAAHPRPGSHPASPAHRRPPPSRRRNACILHTGAESPDVLAIYVAILGAEFEILDPPELAKHITALAGRLTRAARH